MDETEIKHVIEAALLAAGRPLTLERLGEIFSAKGAGPDKATLARRGDVWMLGQIAQVLTNSCGFRLEVFQRPLDVE